MSQKAPTIKLGGARYEDATQASIHYQTRASLKVMFRITTKTVWKFIKRTWASYTTGQISRKDYICKMCYKFLPVF